MLFYSLRKNLEGAIAHVRTNPPTTILPTAPEPPTNLQP
jgi:hypothetical protein